MSEEETTTTPEEVEAAAEEAPSEQVAPRKGAERAAKVKELAARLRSKNGRKAQPKPEVAPRQVAVKRRPPVNRAEAKRAHARARRESLFRRKAG